MLFWTTIRVSIESLLGNGLRSFLAMLGIIIGVGAVISMLAVGAGAHKKVTQRVANMGTNLLSIRRTYKVRFCEQGEPKSEPFVEQARL